MFYLTFKYFWSHDRKVAQVLQLQQAELQRVETLLSLERKAMGLLWQIMPLGMKWQTSVQNPPLSSHKAILRARFQFTIPRWRIYL